MLVFLLIAALVALRSAANLRTKREELRKLQKKLSRAKRTSDSRAINELESQISALRDDIDGIAPKVEESTPLPLPKKAPPPPEKVVAAVEALPSQQRVTAADLSAQSGIGIDDARLGLKELATALAGADGLSVSASSKGDLLYKFPADVRKELAARSNAAKVRDAKFAGMSLGSSDAPSRACRAARPSPSS